jgi:pseudaminic acid synthase
MNSITIGNTRIGEGSSCFIVAEMSANHNQSYERALEILRAAKESGADAVKVQTYRPDTITIDCNNKHFRIEEGPWAGQTLYELYEKAYMPWEWHEGLLKEAESLGMTLFSSPFDVTAVDFLEQVGIKAYKVASFELVDTPLVEHIAARGKPVMLSTGMSTLGEIDSAVRAIRKKGNSRIILLKCVSAYPARPEAMNLRTIRNMAEVFGCPVGLSDHSLGAEVAVCAVALGACVVEKHFTLSRREGGPDSGFSMEPDEFRNMVKAIRGAEKAMGEVSYQVTPDESKQRIFRRSLFVVCDVQAGEKVTSDNVRSIRPASGLPPHYLERILGRTFRRSVSRGTPVTHDLIDF